ncbi:BRO-N domain-containing protein [uncultured Sulfitobacter sp.]|uniref:BRO-N domain-containing protein n=1 Tax=Sulfitobacter sp. SH22 TaxID=3421172 RepID=UPI0025D7CE25|nr:BRO family protein [uncultured Sulfitobacter sp.]
MEIDGNPWFVAADVCKALSISNISTALLNIGSTEVQSYRVPNTKGRMNKIVTESGLYDLILQSRKPEAREFKAWVTGTVLPAIRKDGGSQTTN